VKLARKVCIDRKRLSRKQSIRLGKMLAENLREFCMFNGFVQELSLKNDVLTIAFRQGNHLGRMRPDD